MVSIFISNTYIRSAADPLVQDWVPEKGIKKNAFLLIRDPGFALFLELSFILRD